MKANTLNVILLATAAALLAGCGSKSEDEAPAAASIDPNWPGMEADLKRTLEEQSDFYVFKTTADFEKETAALEWEDGGGLPEFADVNAKKGGTLDWYILDFPRTLRTVGPDATGGIRQFMLDYVAVRFMHPHPNKPGEAYPGVCQRWTLDPEGKTVYMEIDPDARWSDNMPVTTDDVVFTWYFYRSPHLNEPWYNDFYTKTYTRLTIFDKRRFALTLPELKPDIIDRASNIAPYPRHAFQDFGPGWLQRYNWRTLPNTGAYIIEEDDVEKGRSITLTRVEDWWARDLKFWRGRYNPDKVRLTVIRDSNKAFESFVRGDLDFFGVTRPELWYDKLPDTFPEVASGYILKSTFYNNIPRPDWGLWINRSRPILDNRDVREGIQHASNFELVCKQYFRGDAVQMQTRSDGYGWRMHPAITAREFDPAKARELFAEAGFDKQGPDGVLTNAQGQRLSFTITTYADTLRNMLPILKQEALKAGLEFNIEILDQTTGWKKVQEKQHEIALVALSRSVELYPRYWEMYHGSNAYEDAYIGPDGQFVEKFSLGKPNPNPTRIRVQTNNMTETFIPGLDKRIEAYDSAESLDEMKRLAAEMEEIIHNDAAWVNGWKLPFYRTAYWRYFKWPEDFNVMQSRDPLEFFLFWIDTEEQENLERARRSGETFPAQVRIFDQYKTE
ncbi:MAG: extracellular solute-binding protein [Opitutaceae bacterium]